MDTWSYLSLIKGIKKFFMEEMVFKQNIEEQRRFPEFKKIKGWGEGWYTEDYFSHSDSFYLYSVSSLNIMSLTL